MTAIHQVLPVFAPHDAIGNHTVAIQRALRSRGIRSEIFAGVVNPGAGHGARTVGELAAGALVEVGGDDTWLLYHASTGSAVAEWFAGRPERKLIDYHNITPASLVAAWEPAIGVELDHGRRQLADLRDAVDVAWADSSYNRRELDDLGYTRTSVLPVFFETGEAAAADTRHEGRLRREKASGGGAWWLSVSRLLPHKAQHDVIKAFATYHREIDGAARLHLVGGIGAPRYAEALEDYVEDLGLRDCVELTGTLSPGELEAHFRVADVYVSLSDHEGFGVPMIEAMARRVPVVAFACTAVPETAGDGALLLTDKRPVTVATAVERVVHDAALREALVRRGEGRVAAFRPGETEKVLAGLVDELLGTSAATR